MAVRNLSYIVRPEDDGSMVRELLKEKLKLSRREISHAKMYEDGIMIDGSQVTVRHEVIPGEELQVNLHENIEQASEIIPQEGPLEVIYEDEDLICLNKPANMVVHPSHGHFTDSLCNRLAWHYQQNGEAHVMRAVGRLDRETSGIIIFGKNRLATAVLSMQGQKGQRLKEYLALCAGTMEREDGTIDLPISDTPGIRMIRRVSPDGDRAVTHFHVERQFEGYALVRLRLETGRTHQIRVHMAAMGHPLLGDHLYGTDLDDWYGMERTALHSAHVEMVHPVSGRKMKFTAALPEDMQALI
ncbi:MAG: RluA family pseudouridine synthase [Butyrivibrio sp.]|jgi:23S rRNA pseudouridine1911/1915/1917 synthase|nr:RluA family pseudouridine synthase [Butyrivibrio sp.]